jgi:hypothetical protein
MLNIIVVWTKKFESQIVHAWNVEVVAFNDAMVEHIDVQH